jgi:outer membrane protein TolC
MRPTFLPLIVSILFCSTLFFWPLTNYADESGVSIQQLLDMAARGPEVKAAKATANEAGDRETSVWRQVYAPKLIGKLGYTHLLNDQALQFPPIGGMAIPPIKLGPDLVLGSVALQQVLFDPANMLYNHPASKRLAQAANLNASRQVKETQGKAMDLYLQVLELRAKRAALDKYIANLKTRQHEIQRLYELGGLGEGDVLKVKLGIDDATQGVRDLKKNENYLADMIAAVLGEDHPVIPADLPDELPRQSSPSGKTDVSEREDIQAIDKQLDALDLSRSGQKSEYLPKLYGFVQHYYSNANLLTKSNFDAAGVQLSWSIFDGGVNLANARATAEQRQALENKRSLAVSSFQADVSNALATLQIKRQEYEERRKDALEAKTVSNLEFKRLKNGKSTVNYLIDAEDQLKDRTEKASLSKVSWYQAWFNFERASGGILAAP